MINPGNILTDIFNGHYYIVFDNPINYNRVYVNTLMFNKNEFVGVVGVYFGDIGTVYNLLETILNEV